MRKVLKKNYRINLGLTLPLIYLCAQNLTCCMFECYSAKLVLIIKKSIFSKLTISVFKTEKVVKRFSQIFEKKFFKNPLKNCVRAPSVLLLKLNTEKMDEKMY